MATPTIRVVDIGVAALKMLKCLHAPQYSTETATMWAVTVAGSVVAMHVVGRRPECPIAELTVPVMTAV
jgi:hypothetical protein